MLLLMLYLCMLYIFIFFFLYLMVNKVDCYMLLPLLSTRIAQTAVAAAATNLPPTATNYLTL